MPKTKETRVALKGENPKKAPKASETTRKVPSHTLEVKNVNDSEGSTSDSSSGHSSGSESDAERRKNTKKPKPAKVKETEPNSPPVPSDSSDDSSDADSDLEAEVNKANAKKKAPAAVTNNGTAMKTKESSDDSSSESEDDSDSDEEMEEAPAPRAAGQADASETTAAAVVHAQPFEPPPGFKPFNTKSANASTLNSLFDPKSLSSKQIWHITAPSSVPLSEIKSVSLSAIQSHQTILSHKGTDYNLAEEPTNNARVLLPSSKSDAYAAVDVPVAKTLYLQQIIRLPDLSSTRTDPTTGSNAAANIKTPAVRAPRPQPKVLKMRCKPPGFGDEDPGTIGSSDDESDSDVEMAGTSNTGFKKPAGVKETKESRSKRKRDEKELAESSPPKDKKRRKAMEAEKKLAEGTKDEAPETAEEKARKKQEKKDKKKKEKSK